MYNLFETREQVQQSMGQRKALLGLKENLKEDIKTSQELLSTIENSLNIVQQIGIQLQEKFLFHINDIVQTAIDAVFPNHYKFEIVFTTKANKSSADIFLLREGIRVDVMEAAGGGVVDIVSFALRLAVWSLSNIERTLILDEPFKNLSVELRPIASRTLKLLSKELDLQVLMVTHDEQLVEIADTIFNVTLKGGVSNVTKSDNM